MVTKANCFFRYLTYTYSSLYLLSHLWSNIYIKKSNDKLYLIPHLLLDREGEDQYII